MEPGIWNLEFEIWNLKSEICNMVQLRMKLTRLSATKGKKVNLNKTKQKTKQKTKNKTKNKTKRTKSVCA